MDTIAEARSYVNSVLPINETIFTASSETVRLSGLYGDINNSGKYSSLRQQLNKMDPGTQFTDMRRMGACPDIVVGSVHAVTEKGQLVIASASGSQLGPYAAGAGKAIFIIGAQKLVPDLETAMRRVKYYCYPKVDTQMREATGKTSSISKILIINEEIMPDRGTIVIVREPIGYESDPLQLF